MNNNMGQGWQFFDNLSKIADGIDDKGAAARAKDEATQLRYDYETTFATPSAMRVLADLKKRYVDPPVLMNYYPDGVNTAVAMAVRATEQRLINMLLTLKNPGE